MKTEGKRKHSRKSSWLAVTQRVRSIQDLEHVVRKRVRVLIATLDDLDLLEKKPRVEDKDTRTLWQGGRSVCYCGAKTYARWHFKWTTYHLIFSAHVMPCGGLVSVPHRQEGRQVYHGLPDSDNLIALQFTLNFDKRVEKCSWYACIMSHDGTLKISRLNSDHRS
ncbi:hypothetical protein PsorP6_003953 [Peronosclerospora sorghi]|uniref:Uncharacterized protein n=1 Tax=Peronosclerospora sorghi TaxID=230839 RepID=A0ACC0VPQ0_9STRA|nr:hypothetical protein PsorP6_003953 [Peronosclerospora sorghi]